MEIKSITSNNNPKVKQWVSLIEKPRERRAQGQFIVEGFREINLCALSGYILKTLIVQEDANLECTEIIQLNKFLNHNSEIYSLSRNLFQKIVYREDKKNAVAVFEWKERKISEHQLSEIPLIVILEKVEKPGNLGAIARTCDAAGVDAIIICDNQTDLFNPNVIRSSLGCIFTVPTFSLSTEEAIAFCRLKKIDIVAAIVDGDKSLFSARLNAGIAIAMGSEANGLSTVWHKEANIKLSIPMFGKVDSMNVSVSTAVILYEALRQRLAISSPVGALQNSNKSEF